MLLANNHCYKLKLKNFLKYFKKQKNHINIFQTKIILYNNL